MAMLLESWVAELALVALAALLLLWASFLRHFSFWSRRGVPQLRPWTPFGNCRRSLIGAKMLVEDLDDIYHELRAEPYAGFYRKATPGLILIDPDLIRQVLVKDFDYFTDREDAPAPDPLLVNNLFNMKGERWRRLRHKLSPMFTSGKLKSMFQRISECGAELAEALDASARAGDVVEVRDACALFTTEVIGSLAFGVKLGCIQDPDCAFRRWGRTLLAIQPRGLTGLLFEVLAPYFWRFIAPKEGERWEVFAFFDNMVKETLEQRLKSESKRNDFMELFIQLHKNGIVDGEKNDDSKWKLTEDEVAAQAFLFYVAGFETSSTTMSFALYELAVNPDVQRRVVDEVDAAVAAAGGVSYDALARMKYLDMVFSETLRKYPPVTALTRQALRPYRLPASSASSGGALLDPGQVVTVPVFSLHHDPAHYPQPERFDPERFSEQAKAQRHPYAYLPFGEGPRFCVGMRLGLLQSKLGLVHLLSQYAVEVSGQTDIPLRLDPTASVLAPSNGIRLRLTRRNKQP